MRPLRVYLAGSFADRDRVTAITETLADLGFEMTNSWQHEHAGESPHTCAVRDLEGIDRADALMVLADTPTTTGGYWVEIGYAIRKQMPIIVVTQEARNVFLHLPGVKVVKSPSEAWWKLRQIYNDPGWRARQPVINHGIA